MEAWFATHSALGALVASIGALTGVARGWLTHRTAVRREEEHTERVRLAVAGTEGIDRASIIRAADRLAPPKSALR